MTSRARAGRYPFAQIMASAASSSASVSVALRSAMQMSASVSSVVAARLELGARERQRLGLVEGRQDERGVVAGLERLGIGAQRAGPRLALGPVGRDDEDEPAPVWHSGGRDRPDRPAIAQGLDPRGCHPSRALPREPLGLGPGVRRARRPLGRICGRPERRDQRLVVGLEQEALAGELVAGRKRPRRERHSPGGDAPAALGRHEIVGRAAVGHDHRPPARERLERRKAEPLAAVRLHQGVAGPVERRDLLERQVVLDQHELGRPRDGLECLHGLVGRLAAVEGARAERLQHQADVVCAREGPAVGLEQEVDALAIGHAARRKGGRSTSVSEAHGPAPPA